MRCSSLSRRHCPIGCRCLSLLLLTALCLLTAPMAFAQGPAATAEASQPVAEAQEVDVKEVVFGHLGDSYEWHITSWGDRHLTVPLPVMLYSRTSGWHCFLSSRLEEHGGSYEGFSIAPEGSRYAGKLVEHDAATGAELRPIDLSLTKVAAALLINSLLLVALILGVSRWYRRHDAQAEAPGGFTGAVEMLVMTIHDDVIKSCVGPRYARFAPYLLTAFFFIFINNLMGLIPIFPAGVNVTGNIAITFVLALCTFVAVNCFGTRHYWKEILWPDVPLWLKAPLPIMPLIELFGIFTKPFALMIRLFANMMAGHMAMLVLSCLIFITASMGPVLNGSMTVASLLFNIFMNALELLVAFIQAYVFTMLSAVFIGMAQEGSESSRVQEPQIPTASRAQEPQISQIRTDVHR